MAAPTPSSVPKTQAVGYPAFNPPTTEHEPHFPYGSYPQLPCRCRMFDFMSENGFMSQVWSLSLLMAVGLAFAVPITALCVFASILIGPGYPLLRVAGMNVSTNAVNASAGTTWRAAIWVEVPGLFLGDFFFHEIESFIYNNSNEARPLALASVGSFRLQSNQRKVMKAIMTTTETPQNALVDELDRAQRTVAIGLGLRMKGRYVVVEWWKRNYSYTEAYCRNLTIVFAESTGEGSLVLDDSLALDNDLASDDIAPIDYLPSCSYGGTVK